VVVDWKEINKKRAALLFLPALVGLFLVNVLRIYLLYLVAIHISPKLAIGLFHSYAGTVLFIIYFIVFLKIFYSWLKK
jgi:exosortase/archaeosortase family protein